MYWFPNETIPNENDTIIIDSIYKPIISNTLDTIIKGSLEINNSSLTINSNEDIKSEKNLSNIFMNSNSYLIINLNNNGDSNINYIINNITCNNNSNNHISINNGNEVTIKDSQISDIKISTTNVVLAGYNIISSLEWTGSGVFSFNYTDNYLVLIGNNKDSFSFGGDFIIRNKVRVVNSVINVNKNSKIKIIEWSNVELQDSIINSNIAITNGSSVLSLVGNNEIQGNLLLNGSLMSQIHNGGIVYDSNRPQLYLGPAFKSLSSKKFIKIQSSDIYISKQLSLTNSLIECDQTITINNTIINIDLANTPIYNKQYLIFTAKQITLESYLIGSISVNGIQLNNDSFEILVKNNIYNNSTKNNKTHSLIIIYHKTPNNNNNNNNSTNNSNSKTDSDYSSNEQSINESESYQIIQMPSSSSRLSLNSSFLSNLFFILSFILILIY
ncbi:hypothetical protein DICPUDRAFT_81357 [Dictyostelium purpureum]|uniref:Uncharacterized protein n=1 Tax=Dictyostelium purpureum TaxID=5786 RepID=F0ZT87_DICPU|nr:uncharacterized protein DICPUDRAFT_81357 [Dictyostelium purpureum]EGC32849.1 hypothetical protein DICPUDRAFT_81357 [Dictyostelium purpureum]|eukprot:XP_003290634.1 hypothetical protein DICPUDRAFT_81357 [Dictyostelium purpureum]